MGTLQKIFLLVFSSASGKKISACGTTIKTYLAFAHVQKVPRMRNMERIKKKVLVALSATPPVCSCCRVPVDHPEPGAAEFLPCCLRAALEISHQHGPGSPNTIPGWKPSCFCQGGLCCLPEPFQMRLISTAIIPVIASVS